MTAVYADINLARCIQPRQMNDITGNYNRFDVFDLRHAPAPRTEHRRAASRRLSERQVLKVKTMKPKVNA